MKTTPGYRRSCAARPLPNHMGFRNLLGKRYGFIKIDRYCGPERGHQLWSGICKRCSRRTVARANNLLTGHTTTCNCLHEDMVADGSCRARHRKSHSPEWVAWQAMHRRCYAKKNKDYKNYGAKGVRMCEGFLSRFDEFYAVMGDRPTDKHSLDRIDPRGGYDCGRCTDCKQRGAPLNCRWATRTVQNRNRRDTIYLTVGKERHSVAGWASIKGIRPGAIHARLKLGWSGADAVLRPIRERLTRR